jgi:TatD DNase family protein
MAALAAAQSSSNSSSNGSKGSNLSLIDIGVNVADDMYAGQYHGKTHHAPDLGTVLARAHAAGVTALIATSTTLEECESNLQLARRALSGEAPPHPHAHPLLYSTVGIHPTRCSVFEKEGGDDVLVQLERHLVDGKRDGKVVAFGEFGLDYDRLHFCGKDLQKLGFERQLDLAARHNLPLFLHNRNTEGDFARILSSRREQLGQCGGVVHSFDGSEKELQEMLELGLYIGINGCSLKTEENCRVVALVPADRLLLETDAPWCGIKPTHFGFQHVKTKFPTVKKEKYKEDTLVKDRNEPCNMVHILEIMHALQGGDAVRSLGELAAVVHGNTVRLFKLQFDDQQQTTTGSGSSSSSGSDSGGSAEASGSTPAAAAAASDSPP